jgi:STE24 endopeptidase
MSPQSILALYIALAALDLGWALFLSSLNYRNVAGHSGLVPEALRASVSAEEAKKSASYSMAGMRLSFVASPIETAIFVAASASGAFGLLDAWTGGASSSSYWHGALFLGAILLANALLSSPFSLYSTFVLEKRYGFNTTSPKTWLLDALKSALISIALGLPLLGLLYTFIDSLGGIWWLVAATAFSCINVLLSILYPLVIAPLFNKFEPLPEGELATKIAELARRVGFRTSGIFVMNGSKRSRHSNAYFTGLGRVKRIVLYDTLVSSMSEEEILAVLAHEMGHEKKRHVLKMTLASIALYFLGFRILDLLMNWPELYAAFGFASPSKHAILLILGLVSGPATFFLNPAFSAWSRKHEYEADTFAVEALASEARAADAAGPDALSSALVRLNRENASNLWPHRLYSFWYYSHPTLVERLAAIGKSRTRRRPDRSIGRRG